MYGVSATIPTSHVKTDSIQSKFDDLLKNVPENHFYPVSEMRKLLTKYSNEDLILIYKDLLENYKITFEGASKALDFASTSGGPASGKSTNIEAILKKEIKGPDGLNTDLTRVYIDPDRTCLLRMKNTYLRDLQHQNRNAQEAYEYWREASNFLCNYYLAIALKEGYAIAYGSTMATPHAKRALNSISSIYKYSVTLIHLTCEEEVREESQQARQQKVVQCTDADFKEKQVMFFSLLNDYVQSADTIFFAYRKNMDTVIWAAKLEKNKLVVHDESAFNAIGDLHDKAQREGFWKEAFVHLQKSENG